MMLLSIYISVRLYLARPVCCVFVALVGKANPWDPSMPANVHSNAGGMALHLADSVTHSPVCWCPA
eukprot:2659905-Amphidinium_carterae.1